MAHGNCAAIDIETVLVNTQGVHRRQAHGGEGLVDLDDVEVTDAHVGLGGLAFAMDPAFGPTPLKTLLSKPWAAGRFAEIDAARSADITSTAAAPSEICEALPAVIVPSVSKAPRNLASDSGVVSLRIPSSVSTRSGSPLRWGTFTAAISCSK